MGRPLRSNIGVIDAEVDERVDRDGGTDSAAGINAIIARISAENPAVSGTWGGQGSNVTGPRTVRGGGTLRLGPGEYRLDSTISLPPNFTLVLDAAHLVANHAGDMIDLADDGLGNFNRNNVSIKGQSGAGLHGEGVGDNGLYLNHMSSGNIEGLIIENFLGDGVLTGTMQWVEMSRVDCIGNGGWGFALVPDTAFTARYVNDFLMSRCMAEENGAGGMLVGSSGLFTAIGSSFQFHDQNPGVRFQQTDGGLIKGANLIGCHIEANRYGVEILSDAVGNDAPKGVNLIGCEWVISDGTGVGSGVANYPLERFVVNEGFKTAVRGGGVQNSSTQMPDTQGSSGAGPTSTAMFEQSSTSGDLHIYDFFGVRGAIDLPYTIDEAGVVYAETFNQELYNYALTAIGRDTGGGNPFPAGGFFGPAATNI